jgi:hypothetical protein
MLKRRAVRSDAAVVIPKLGWAVQHQFIELAGVGVVGLGSGTMWSVPRAVRAQDNSLVHDEPPFNHDRTKVHPNLFTCRILLICPSGAQNSVGMGFMFSLG